MYLQKYCKACSAPFLPVIRSQRILRIFSQPLLVSFKRDKNIGNFLVRSVLKSDDQRGTFKCARKRCNTCPFIHNANKITGPKRSIKITDRFTCTSANVIYCITCTLCKKICIGWTGRRLGDRFRKHLYETLKEMTTTHPNQSPDISISLIILFNMTICGLSLHQGNTERRKNL